jgi:hypothetical protein
MLICSPPAGVDVDLSWTPLTPAGGQLSYRWRASGADRQLLASKQTGVLFRPAADAFSDMLVSSLAAGCTRPNQLPQTISGIHGRKVE